MQVMPGKGILNDKDASSQRIPSADTFRNHNVGTLPVVPTVTGGLTPKSYWEYNGVTSQLYKKVAGGEEGENSKLIHLQAIIHLLITVWRSS